jgi:hypothetical protein
MSLNKLQFNVLVLLRKDADVRSMVAFFRTADKAYRRFFTIWKDADRELQVLLEAKSEYERLRTKHGWN